MVFQAWNLGSKIPDGRGNHRNNNSKTWVPCSLEAFIKPSLHVHRVKLQET